MSGPDVRDGTRSDGETLVPSPGAARLGEAIRAGANRERDRYVALDSVGQGAMGTVIRAYDPKLAREVALKRVRTDSALAGGEGRLVTEARALARLSHPCVVAVYDVDVHDDEVTIAMEYVHGDSLERWLAADVRARRDIMQVFLAAGQGLAAAHIAGLVHRDFKPTNVIVSGEGRRRRVRVIDFGLAHQHEIDPSRAGAGAGAGAGVVDPSEVGGADTEIDGGTPRYMAPEQHRHERVGPAADQFAFCLALWESLAGRYPFADPEQTLLEAKERGPADSLEGLSTRVEAILRRGLRADPEQRWPSMRALLTALRRTTRFGRRRRYVGLGAAVLAIGGGATYAVTQAAGRPCRSGRELIAEAWNPTVANQVKEGLYAADAAYADESWPRVQARVGDYVEAWTAQHRAACEATAVAGTQPAAALDLRMTCLHHARIEIGALGASLAEADQAVARRAVDAAADLPELRRCDDVDALARSGARPPTEATARRVDLAREALARARVARALGQYANASEITERVWEAAQEIGHPPLLSEAGRERALSLERSGDLSRALTALGAATRASLAVVDHERAVRNLAMAAHLLGRQTADHGAAIELVALARTVGEGLGLDERTMAAVDHAESIVFSNAGRLKEAEAAARRAVEVKRRIHGERELTVAASLNNLGNVLRHRGSVDESIEIQRLAIEIKREQLGPGHADVASALSNLGNGLQAAGRPEEAIAVLTEAIGLLDNDRNTARWRAAAAKANLASALVATGEHERAIEIYREAIATTEAEFDAEHPMAAKLHGALGIALFHAGRHEAARAQIVRGLQMLDDHPHEQRLNAPLFLGQLCLVHVALGDVEDAVDAGRRALAAAMLVYGPDHRETVAVRSNLAIALIESGAFVDAEVQSREALRVLEKARGASDADVRTAATTYGRALLGRGADAAARANLERFIPEKDAWSALTQGDAKLLAVYARAVWPLRDRRHDALEMAKAARDTLATDPTSDDEQRAIEAWLASH